MKSVKWLALVYLMACCSSGSFFMRHYAKLDTSKAKVLYIGMDNLIDLSIKGIDKDSILLVISNGSIINSDDHYIARVSKAGETKINVYEKRRGSEKILRDSQIYRSIFVPDWQ